jgi:steroid delta-isomerase-like uncharacterized protein
MAKRLLWNHLAAGMAGAAVLAFAVSMPIHAAADEATAALDRHQQGVEDFNSQDADSVANVYAEDAVLHDPQVPEPIRGREAIQESYEAMFRMFPDAKVTMLNRHAEGNLIMYEFRFSGTNEGPIGTPEGDIPPTGQRVEMPMAVFADVDEDGRFADARRYYDVAEMMRQLGLEE